MTRPRAADDFTAIRARMEELRRERAATPADTRQAAGPLPYAAGVSAPGAAGRSSGLSPIMRRSLGRVRIG